MPRRKQNPESGTMLLLLGAAAAAIYGWTQGWFSPVPVMTATPPPQPSTGTTNPITPATQIVNAPPLAPPPLGTVVNNANDIAAQATAGYAYILPDQTMSANMAALAPNGYTPMVTNDYGTIFLRGNVYQVAYTDLQNRIARATSQGASGPSVQAASQLSLQQIQNDMSTNGITGLRGRARMARALNGLNGGWN